MSAEVGLGIQSDKRPGDYARLAVAAEHFGFDVLSIYADLFYQPPLAGLLEMAAATERVRLGAACWNPYTLHPYEIAGQMANLDAASGGRGYLGLARGAWLGALGVGQPRPLAHLEQAVALIRALLTGDDTAIVADTFPLAAGSRLRYELPERLPKLLLGTWGPRTAELAGRIADEVKVGGSSNPAMISVMRERIAPGTEQAGRDLDEVGIVLGAVCVVDEDGAAARALARREVAMYLAVVADLDPTADLDPAMLTQLRRSVAAGEPADDLIGDEVLDLFAFSGTPEQVAAQARKLFDAGASRVEFGTPHGLTTDSGIELLGRRVLPMLDLHPG